MPVCEKCWAEYSLRRHSNRALAYTDVVAENDAAGGHTNEEQCGDLHALVNYFMECRCGKVREAM